VIVWRVEHPESGRGPHHHATYLETDNNPSYGLWSDYESGLDAQHHPLPHQDGLRNVDYDGMLFGFASLWKLKEWFNENDRAIMYDFGFHIVTFLVPDDKVKKGWMQLVFDEHSALRSRTYSLLLGWEEDDERPEGEDLSGA